MRRRRRRSRSGQAEGPFSLFSFQDIIAAVSGVMIVATILLAINLLARDVVLASSPTHQAVSIDKTELEALRLRRDRLRHELASQPISQAVPGSSLEQLSVRLSRAQDLRIESMAELISQQAAAAALGERAAVLDERARRLSKQLADVEERTASQLNAELVTRLEGRASAKRTLWVRLGQGAILAGHVQSGDVTNDSIDATSEVIGGTLEEALAWLHQADSSRESVVLLVEPEGIERFDTLQAELRSRGFDVGWDLVLPDSTEARP